MNRFFMNFKRNLKGAFKSIKSNFREYICFFLALIMVQVLFGTVTVAFRNNRAVEKKAIDDAGYDYHAQLTGLTVQDINILHHAYQASEDQKNQHYFEYDDKREDGKVTLVFTGDVKRSCHVFSAGVLAQMNASERHVNLITTPLYDYTVTAGADTPIFLVILLLLMLLSFLLLMALFRIRINHFKFTYSIYMAYGADFKKLMGSAFHEMLLIALFSYLPSLLLTYGISALLYLPFGRPFGFYAISLPVVLFCSLVCATLALILPMRVLASGAPIKHMKAQDNSNLVTSPRRSKLILKSSILKIELLSVFRYRKHIAILMASTVTFAALGVAGCYLADIYAKRTDVPGSDLSLKFADTDTADFFFGYFGEQAAEKKISSYVLEKRAHDPFEDAADDSEALLPHLMIPGAKALSASFTDHPVKKGWAATTALEIRAFDADALGCFDSIYHYSCKGDPEKALTDPYALILSSSLANSSGNKLSPGDRVYMPVARIPLETHGEDDLLTFETLLSETIFVYREFTVAAVIDNYADYDRMLIYLPTVKPEGGKSGYEEVMGQAPDYTDVNIYLSDKNDVSAVTQFVQTFVSHPAFSEKAAFRLDYGDLSENVLRGKNFRGLILVLSALVFAVSPIAGFFSQILFYEKRRIEFDMLRAVGGTQKTLRTLFLVDGAVLSLVSGALYALLSFAAVRLLCALLNAPFIFALFGKATHANRFFPTIPVFPFILGLVLTLLFSFAEVTVCLLRYRKQTNEQAFTGFTADDEH